MYDCGARFLKTQLPFLFRSLYNKMVKGFRSQPSASADILYREVDYSGYHKNLILYLFTMMITVIITIIIIIMTVINFISPWHF